MSSFQHPLIVEINSIPQFKQKSTEWLNQRKGFLTSSDAASALGINPYSSRDELVFKKCDLAVPFTGNIATRHGERYEDEAIERYCAVMGMTNFEFGLIPYKAVPRDDHREEYDFLAGSPDGIALENGYTAESEPVMIEVKCPFRRKPIQGKCPEHYKSQVYLNMLICKCNKADFIEYVPNAPPGEQLFITRILLDEAKRWWDDNLHTLTEFWGTVLHYRSEGIETHPLYDKISTRVNKAVAKLELREKEYTKEKEENDNMASCCMLADSDSE